MVVGTPGGSTIITSVFQTIVNVIDFNGLKLHAPEIVHDLPAGGKRLVQKADGYTLTMCAGEVTYQNGEHTGALPGRLLRGGRAAPQ